MKTRDVGLPSEQRSGGWPSLRATITAKTLDIGHVLVGLMVAKLTQLADDVPDQNGQFTRALADQIS
jgi:hypothetical protein